MYTFLQFHSYDLLYDAYAHWGFGLGMDPHIYFFSEIHTFSYKTAKQNAK